MSEREYDVVVIGGGPAGEVLAGRLTEKSDKQVALVEGHLLGGECSYYACMPSKALLRPQEALREVRRIPGAREAAGGELAVEAVLDRRDEVIHGLDDGGQVDWVRSRGIDLFQGHGRLDGERRVRVAEDLLTARDAVVVAVGSRAAMPPVEGLSDVEPWGNRELTTSREVPRRLVVLGGGVVGVEMAQAWASLGSEVVLVELFDRLLANEEPFAGEQLREAFEGLGIEVRTRAKTERAEATDDGLALVLEDGTRVEGDRLLVAVGRRAATEDLGLETVGLEPGEFLEVDESLRVPGHPWLYAIGDVSGRSLLTHMGKYQARLACDRIVADGGATDGDGDPGLRPGGGTGAPVVAAHSPRVVFTDPQVAAVGHTLASAREAGIEAREVDLPTGGTAGASFYGRGASETTRFVVDSDREVLVGVTFVGPDVVDFLHAATIAVAAELPLRTLVHAVPPFPARSELWLEFLEAYGL